MSEAEGDAVKLYLEELDQMTQSRGGGGGGSGSGGGSLKKTKPSTPPAKKQIVATPVSVSTEPSPSTDTSSSSSTATAKTSHAPATKKSACNEVSAMMAEGTNIHFQGERQQLPSNPHQRTHPAQGTAPSNHVLPQTSTPAPSSKARDHFLATSMIRVKDQAKEP